MQDVGGVDERPGDRGGVADEAHRAAGERSEPPRRQDLEPGDDPPLGGPGPSAS